KTNTQISRTAFRKIIDNIQADKPYSPHSATRNALAKYVGYESWQQYASSDIKGKKSNRRLVVITILVGVILLSGTLFFLTLKTPSYNFDFTIENPTGTIPHTLKCKYDLSKVRSENIKIDYGHVNHKNKYTLYDLRKNKTVHKECFHHPGRYNIRVFIDEKVQYFKKVWINSNDWYIYTTNSGWDNKDFIVPDFLRKAGVGLLQSIPFEAILEREIDSLGFFHIPEEKIRGIEHITVNYELHMKNFRPFDVDMRDCEFSIRFKDDDFGNGTHCYETLISLWGEKTI
ncbi:MAG: hypothetical protein MI922_00320, partial [Bacteroidales bacterium]|nr:hypothetical protein [Bacteroidales bacterium]